MICEYNADGLLIKATENDENVVHELEYNSNGLVSKATSTYFNNGEYSTYVSVFTYDQNGNVITGASENNPSKYKDVFTYDDQKNPYSNMNIDFTYQDYDYGYELPITQKVTNNIL